MERDARGPYCCFSAFVLFTLDSIMEVDGGGFPETKVKLAGSPVALLFFLPFFLTRTLPQTPAVTEKRRSQLGYLGVRNHAIVSFWRVPGEWTPEIWTPGLRVVSLQPSALSASGRRELLAPARAGGLAERDPRHRGSQPQGREKLLFFFFFFKVKLKKRRTKSDVESRRSKGRVESSVFFEAVGWGKPRKTKLGGF